MSNYLLACSWTSSPSASARASAHPAIATRSRTGRRARHPLRHLTRRISLHSKSGLSPGRGGIAAVGVRAGDAGACGCSRGRRCGRHEQAGSQLWNAEFPEDATGVLEAHEAGVLGEARCDGRPDGVEKEWYVDEIHNSCEQQACNGIHMRWPGMSACGGGLATRAREGHWALAHRYVWDNTQRRDR